MHFYNFIFFFLGIKKNRNRRGKKVQSSESKFVRNIENKAVSPTLFISADLFTSIPVLYDWMFCIQYTFRFLSYVTKHGELKGV